MNTLHVTVDGYLALLILLLPAMGIALGWCIRDIQAAERKQRKEKKQNGALRDAEGTGNHASQRFSDQEADGIHNRAVRPSARAGGRRG